MGSSADDIVRTVVDALEQRAAARGETVSVLDPFRDLIANDGAEIATDHLVNTVYSFQLTLRRDEYGRLVAGATRLGVA
ncbi:hypothetical protein QNO07_26240 [Streptomyces sp. 549]|uniref:hypothetical protein n=1 Tax=Streptomyces sp. 549 TaxID=3049076 RepID=UPI0024C3DDA8|nr:hypothetical protein [Streptomyces sp. 549]MDK1476860.1 hypothetical protein [Streptomyces sp. 549]